MTKPTLPALLRPMDEFVEGHLCTAYQVSDPAHLDPKVVESYRQLKLSSERMGTNCQDSGFLYAVIVQSGVPVPDRPTTFLDYVREGLVNHDDPVLVKWRTKWEQAKYLKLSGSNVLVELDGSTRALDHTLVKFPEESTAS